MISCLKHDDYDDDDDDDVVDDDDVNEGEEGGYEVGDIENVGR